MGVEHTLGVHERVWEFVEERVWEYFWDSKKPRFLMFGTFSLQLNFFHTPLLQQSPFQSRDPPKIVQPRTAMCFALLFYHMAMIILGQPLPNFPFETERHRSCKHIRHPSFLESIKQHLETRASKRIINSNMFFGNHITIYALLSRWLLRIALFSRYFFGVLRGTSIDVCTLGCQN